MHIIKILILVFKLLNGSLPFDLQCRKLRIQNRFENSQPRGGKKYRTKKPAPVLKINRAVEKTIKGLNINILKIKKVYNQTWRFVLHIISCFYSTKEIFAPWKNWTLCTASSFSLLFFLLER